MFEIKRGAGSEIPINVNGEVADRVNKIEAIFKLSTLSTAVPVLKKVMNNENGNLSRVSESCVRGTVKLTSTETVKLPVGVIYMDTVVYAVNEGTSKTEVVDSGSVQKGRVIEGFNREAGK